MDSEYLTLRRFLKPWKYPSKYVAARPRAAFFDEPTAFLDRDKRGAVLAVLDMLWKRGVATAWSTHYPPEADKAAVAYEVIDGAVKRIH